MALTFQESSISETWLEACKALRRGDGQDANFCLVISPDAKEDKRISAVLEKEVHEMKIPRASWIDRVAESIFPVKMYRPSANDVPGEARKHLYSMQEYRREFLRRGGVKPSYFDRLVAWPVAGSKTGKTHNQLEHNVIAPLERAKHNRNCLELSTIPLGEPGELRIHEPSQDRKVVGGPCLSHISFTLIRDKVVLTAIYRNHYYITKAYGNLIGLRDLQLFVSRETGYDMGELMCVSSHADLYEGNFSQRRIDRLIRNCEAAFVAPHTATLVGV